jgi:hypothetical protein
MRWVLGLILLLPACAAEESIAPRPVPQAAANPAATPPARAARRTPPPAAATPAPAGPAVPPAVVAAVPPPVWRVMRDGTTGCADPAALQSLREPPGADPAALRRLAAARASGGCVTVFRAMSWRILERADDMLRLAPAEADNGATGPLFFWRDQVVQEGGG